MAETQKINLRLPPELHQQASELAAYQCTSLNAVTVAALRSWIEYQNRMRKPGQSTRPASSPARRGLPFPTHDNAP